MDVTKYVKRAGLVGILGLLVTCLPFLLTLLFISSPFAIPFILCFRFLLPTPTPPPPPPPTPPSPITDGGRGPITRYQVSSSSTGTETAGGANEESACEDVPLPLPLPLPLQEEEEVEDCVASHVDISSPSPPSTSEIQKQEAIALIHHDSSASGSSKTVQNDSAIEQRQDLQSEDNIWGDIYAVRKIVGYTGIPEQSCAEELKALYVFTGVQPSQSLNEDNIKEKIEFLKYVIGVM